MLPTTAKLAQMAPCPKGQPTEANAAAPLEQRPTRLGTAVSAGLTAAVGTKGDGILKVQPKRCRSSTTPLMERVTRGKPRAADGSHRRAVKSPAICTRVTQAVQRADSNLQAAESQLFASEHRP